MLSAGVSGNETHGREVRKQQTYKVGITTGLSNNNDSVPHVNKEKFETLACENKYREKQLKKTVNWFITIKGQCHVSRLLEI